MGEHKEQHYRSEQEEEFKTKLYAIEAVNNATKEELESKTEKLIELEGLADASTAELDLVKKERACIESERDELKSNEAEMKAKIEALLLENASLRENPSKETSRKKKREWGTPTRAPKVPRIASDIPPPWNPSPIPAGEPVEDTSRDNSFGADDTFDESMFLPNVGENANKTLEVQETDENSKAISTANKTLEVQETDENSKTISTQSMTRRMTRSMNQNSTPQTDENSKTPSKTPFKEKRALFSPQEKAKGLARRTTRRMTRSMNKMRTPLGKSSAQNTPSSSCKVRTNWRNQQLSHE